MSHFTYKTLNTTQALAIALSLADRSCEVRFAADKTLAQRLFYMSAKHLQLKKKIKCIWRCKNTKKSIKVKEYAENLSLKIITTKIS